MKDIAVGPQPQVIRSTTFHMGGHNDPEFLTALAVVGAVAFAPYAMAQSQPTTVKSSKSNTSDIQDQTGGAAPAAKTTTVKSSKSNGSERMGGGGGAKGAASANSNDAINLNSSRSNKQ